MKTGLLFWSMRKTYLEKVIRQHENNVVSIENELQHLITLSIEEHSKPTKSFNLVLMKIDQQKIELKHEKKALDLAQKRFNECNVNLKLVESPNRITGKI